MKHKWLAYVAIGIICIKVILKNQLFFISPQICDQLKLSDTV